MQLSKFNLPRYDAILRGKRQPEYLIAKNQRLNEKILVSFCSGEIEKSVSELIKRDMEPTSLLDFLSLITDMLAESCILCERRCRVDRRTKKGWCRVPYDPKISSIFLHFGEEHELVPSLTVFFSGCNFHCIYCQNSDIARYPEAGKALTPNELLKAIKIFEYEAKNVNFVGGDPTPAAHFILKTLLISDFYLPVIWNSNMYMSVELMKVLDCVVDIHLADFKYGNDECAKKLSKTDRYFEVVTRNLLEAYKNSDVIIRHLVLPGHIECCTEPVIRWIEENLPGANLNVMFQYYPCDEAIFSKDLNRRLSDREKRQVIELLRASKLTFARAC